MTRRADAQEIWHAGVEAVDPKHLVRAAMAREKGALRIGDQTLPLSEIGRLVVVGAGKAGAAMTTAVEEVLGQELLEQLNVEGLVNVPDETLCPTRRIHLKGARKTHDNKPTEEGVVGARRIAELVEGCRKKDVLLCLISGGGSALLPAPAEGISFADKRSVTTLLLDAGATIFEMNAVRKHLSALKGGGLAARFGGKLLISLILSDVVGDPLDVIASGPTANDPTTFQDALAVLDRHRLRGKVPRSVLHRLTRGALGQIDETPKRLSPKRFVNHIIGSGQHALKAAAQRARDLGYDVLDLGDRIEGETKEVAKALGGIASSARARRKPTDPPLCILSGGETTVSVGDNPGKGGRNQEMVLALLVHLMPTGLQSLCLLSGGTDGEDGPTDAAGAFVDAALWRRAKGLGQDPVAHLQNHDAYPFFERAGGLLRPGLTGTNVMDLRVFLIG